MKNDFTIIIMSQKKTFRAIFKTLWLTTIQAKLDFSHLFL